MAPNERKQSSPGIDEIRQLFLAVKHSEKDIEAVDKRLENSRIRNIHTQSFKFREEEVPKADFLRKLDEFIQEELITQGTKSTVMGIGKSERMMEEVLPRKDRLGYLAAVDIEGKMDFVLIVVESSYDVKPTLCSCCLPSRQRQIKQDYERAIMINYMRNKIFEELKIEGLTTRGQHHKRDRFRPRTSKDETANALIEEHERMNGRISCGETEDL
eukprot:maker-scaffold155_size301336-snap-gene-0.13 protein:Tk03780 transcript:maker-scaffold155_size301336-snap-gene-0.13-mRNA-1 annotation:"uncharacterized protein FFUJ_07773"